MFENIFRVEHRKRLGKSYRKMYNRIVLIENFVSEIIVLQHLEDARAI